MGFQCSIKDCDGNKSYSWRGTKCDVHERERNRASYQRHRVKVLAREKPTYGSLKWAHKRVIWLKNWDLRTGKTTACDFTADCFLTKVAAPCTYCGAMGRNGIDRIDNNRGHDAANVVPCCKTCNIAKSILTADAYIEHCKRVIAFSLKGK